MSALTRRAIVKQAEIRRAIRALEDAGYAVGAIRLDKDGFEVVPAISGQAMKPVDPKRPVTL